MAQFALVAIVAKFGKVHYIFLPGTIREIRFVGMPAAVWLVGNLACPRVDEGSFEPHRKIAMAPAWPNLLVRNPGNEL